MSLSNNPFLPLDRFARRVCAFELGDLARRLPAHSLLTNHRRELQRQEGERLAEEAKAQAKLVGISHQEWEQQWEPFNAALWAVWNTMGVPWSVLDLADFVPTHEELLRRFETCQQASVGLLRLGAWNASPDEAPAPSDPGKPPPTWEELFERLKKRIVAGRATQMPPGTALPLPAQFDFLTSCCELGPGPADELNALSRRWQALVERYPSLQEDKVLARIEGADSVPPEARAELQQLVDDLRTFGRANGCIKVRPGPLIAHDLSRLRSISSPEQLLAFCRERKAELAPSTEGREMAAVLHLELLIEMWAVMDRLGTVVPPRPPLLRADRNEALVACLRDEKDKCPHPEDVLAAYDTVIGWCVQQIEAGRGQGTNNGDQRAQVQAAQGSEADSSAIDPPRPLSPPQEALPKGTGQTPAVLTADDEDILILRALHEAAPRRLTTYEIEAATDVTRKTVGKRLVKLIDRDLVIRPDGPKGGATITQPGQEFLAKLPAPK
jgi:hypothetical protein